MLICDETGHNYMFCPQISFVSSSYFFWLLCYTLNISWFRVDNQGFWRNGIYIYLYRFDICWVVLEGLVVTCYWLLMHLVFLFGVCILCLCGTPPIEQKHARQVARRLGAGCEFVNEWSVSCDGLVVSPGCSFACLPVTVWTGSSIPVILISYRLQLTEKGWISKSNTQPSSLQQNNE